MDRLKGVFNKQMERKIVEHLKLETRLFGFTRKGVLDLAYQFENVNPFSTIRTTGSEWLIEFRRRNSEYTRIL